MVHRKGFSVRGASWDVLGHTGKEVAESNQMQVSSGLGVTASWSRVAPKAHLSHEKHRQAELGAIHTVGTWITPPATALGSCHRAHLLRNDAWELRACTSGWFPTAVAVDRNMVAQMYGETYPINTNWQRYRQKQVEKREMSAYYFYTCSKQEIN